jgi:hypothetical protein
MVGWIGIAVIIVATIVFSAPSEAAFLLNCRLMGPDTHPQWRQGCKWETLISECKPDEPCKVKRQNFLSLSAKAAITANLKWRTTIIVSGTTTEAASLAATMNSPGLATSSNATAAGITLAGPIGKAAGTLNGVVSDATGAVNQTGLVP